MALLDPFGANIKLIAFFGVLVMCAVGGYGLAEERYGRKLEQANAAYAQRVADAERVRAGEEKAQREIEAARDAARKDVDHVASLARARADSDRRSADAAHSRLLDAARAAAGRASQACAHPEPAGERQAAGVTGVVLAELLGRADEAAGELAAVLDASHAAGTACERLHDSLSK